VILRSLLEDEPKEDEVVLPDSGTSLTLLQAIYRSATIPLMTRMRAAQAAIPIEHPKLAVTASIEVGDFADQLEQAIERSRRVMIEAKPIVEANTSNDTANAPSNTTRPHVQASNSDGHKPSVVDRRYRRW
jgi:hypothetical protein